MSEFEHTDDAARASWIEPRLSNDWPSIASQVPSGFERYVRIFHDVEGSRWRDVCVATGATWHPLMQWHQISRGWPDGEPHQGSLGSTSLAMLATLLDDGPITVGLWNGYGQIDGQGMYTFAFAADTPSTPQGQSDDGWVTRFDADVLAGALLALPGREYALFTGSVAALRSPHWREHSGWAWRWNETVNLAWADDANWFLLSEIDYDSTIVACSAQTADRILDSSLEAALISHGAPLTHDADTVNG